MAQGGTGPRRFVVLRAMRRVMHLFVDLVSEELQPLAIEHALLDEKPREADDGIAFALGLTFGLRLVKALVVGERVRVEADHVGMHQRRSAAFPAPVGGLPHGAVGGQEIGAIHFHAEQAGKARDQARNAAAGGLAFDGDGDRVAVVLDEEQHRQSLQTGGIERFPELALAGGAFARGDQRNLAGWVARVARGFGASHGLVVLRAGGRGRADDVKLPVAPMGRHLAAARSGVGGRADSLLQHLVGGDAESQAERAVAVIGKEPVVPGPQDHAGGHLDGLMSGGTDLKENAVLAFECDLAVIQPPGGVHQAERTDELLGL